MKMLARRMVFVGMVAFTIACPEALLAAPPTVTHVCPMPLPDADHTAFCVMIAQGTGLTGGTATLGGTAVTTVPISDCLLAIECATKPAGIVPVTVTTAGGTTTVPVTFVPACDPVADLACLLDLFPCFRDENLIRNAGVDRALTQQLNNALASLQRGQQNTAINQLRATTRFLSAQSGHAIVSSLATALIDFLDGFLLPCISRIDISFPLVEQAVRHLGVCPIHVKVDGEVFENMPGEFPGSDGIQVFADCTVSPACLPAVVTLSAEIRVSVTLDGVEHILEEPVTLLAPVQGFSTPRFSYNTSSMIFPWILDSINEELTALHHPDQILSVSVCVVLTARVVDSCGCETVDRKERCGTVTVDGSGPSGPVTVFSGGPPEASRFQELPCDIVLRPDHSATVLRNNNDQGVIRHGFSVSDADCPPVTVAGHLRVSVFFRTFAHPARSLRVQALVTNSIPARRSYGTGGRDTFGYDIFLSSLTTFAVQARNYAAQQLGVFPPDLEFKSLDFSIILEASDSCGCDKVVTVSTLHVL